MGASAVFDKPFDLDGFTAFVGQLLPPQGTAEGVEPGQPG